MSAGIYMNNGVLAYSMDLEKKLKRRKQAVIIEEYKGDLTGDLLEQQLQIMLNKHLKITQTDKKEETEDIFTIYTYKLDNIRIEFMVIAMDNFMEIVITLPVGDLFK